MIKNSDYQNILFITLLILSINANANGINPPRPSGSETVHASCQYRDTDTTIKVERVRVRSSVSKTALYISFAGLPQKLVQLSDIDLIRMLQPEPDANGYVYVELHLNSPSYIGNGYVLISFGDQEFELIGFTKDRTRISFPITRCKEIDFKQSGRSDNLPYLLPSPAAH